MNFAATLQPRTVLMLRIVMPIVLGAFITSKAHAQPVLEERANALGPAITQEFRLRDFSIQRLSVPQSRSESVSMPIRLADRDYEMTIAPHRVFAPGYKLLVDLGDDRIEEMSEGEVATFRGTIAGIPGSIVAGGRAGEGLVARIILPDDQTYWIEPLKDRVTGATLQEHVIYRSEDSLPHDGTCGTLDEAVTDLEDSQAIRGARGSGCGGGVCVAEIACDADFEYFNDYGSVTNVQNRIATVINAMNAQYESQVGITHQIVTILVRTSQVYTSNDAGTLLNQFAARWDSNHTDIARDIAHLFTGKSLQAPTIGIARLSAICMPIVGGFGYGLVESDFNGNFSCATDLSAHELGHNWSAQHCNCPNFTMNPSITCANNFSASTTVPGIISFRDSRSCLGAFESGVTILPFVDEFPSATLDSSKWTGIEGAESNAGGSGEPSASNSLNIDGSDQIRSAIIDTAAPLGLDLSYFWQRTGTGNSPEPGEDLIVEYLNNTQLWIELTRYPGDGSDSDPFQLDSFELPTDALHDQFRLRFRGVSSNAGFDDWFIDDINIEGCFGATVSPQPQPVSDCPGANVQFTTVGTGGGPISYQWLKDGIVLNNGGGVSGVTTDTLSINSISEPTDEGNYTCEITNECGTLSTEAAELAVFDSASIIDQPASAISACTGDATIITVSAAGDGLTYEWKKNGVLLNDGGNISGATTAVLTVSDLSLSDAADTPGYTCTVSDNCGNAVDSSAAVLDIVGADITSQPGDTCADDGEMATFSATFTPPPGFSTFIQWHKDGTPLSDGGNISGSFTDTLTINPASAADVGGYALRVLVLGPNCIVFSDEGQLSIGDCGCTSAAECDDFNPCTDDACDDVLGCLNTPNTNPCNDGDACTTDDTCSAGVCVGSTPLVCDDGLFCNGSETCDSGSGCVEDVDPCGGATWCDESSDQCLAFGDGDFNLDGAVDLIDFQAFQSCFGAPAGGGCESMNLTGDAIVDLDDLGAFVGLLTGP